MKNTFSFNILALLIFLTVALQQQVLAKPLYTDSRWIVDGEGTRVKLACVNWPSHLQQVLAEGLHRKPVDMISKKIRAMGFNCVRFTWPTDLANNETLASTTVHDSFKSLGLFESISGLQVNNKDLLNQSLIQAFQNVVENLGENKLMVILDNHISTPGWCCDWNDGNGFFGDKYFDPQYWLKGLTYMATLFRGKENVIGMSLRNEPRGPKQNLSLWYRYMQGAEAVHAANPDVIVILSGLNYAKDLSFLNKQQVTVSFEKKLAFEGHWYPFTDGDGWAKNNPNDFCGKFMNELKNNFGFLLEQGYPLILSEFGANQRDINVNDNRYFNCILGVIADLDMDWALWTLQGSYYLRQTIYGLEEAYGLLTWDWANVRNSSYLHRINTVQSPFQGPGISVRTPYTVIFHPLSGLCVQKNPLKLGPCKMPQAWSYTQEKNIKLYEVGLKCLQAVGMSAPAMLGTACGNSSAKWEAISNSKMHYSAKLASDEIVCLDVDEHGVLVTNLCKCLEKDPNCDPASQWFKLITSVKRSQKNDNV